MAKRKRSKEPTEASTHPKSKKDKSSVAKGETTAKASSDFSAIPLRDISLLYASPDTMECAKKCVPCAYKLGVFDVSLDKDFCRQVPNQRPEQCPRISKTNHEAEDPKSVLTERSVMGYQRGMSVLTVGDGDLSFSLAIARIVLGGKNVNLEDSERYQTSRVVATSYEKEETLRQVYPNFEETVAELHHLGAKILYQVDATRLNETFGDDDSAMSKFDRICWNFPCTAISKGQDGQNQEMEDNKSLVRSFVKSATPFLKGEIHICHKSKPPFNQWKLESVVKEGNADMSFLGRIVLDRAILPPYVPRKALDRKSFPCHDACFYIFEGQPRTEKFPSTLPHLEVEVESKNESAAWATLLTRDYLLSLRSRCIRVALSAKHKSTSRYGKNKRAKR